MNRTIVWASILCVVGIALIIFSTVWITVIEPGLEKLPTDLDESYTIEATVQEIFPQANETEIIIERNQWATGEESGTLIIRDEIIPTPEVPGILEKTVIEMGVDRTSREFVPGYGDIERSELWAYPVGVDKKTYSVWSDTAGFAPDAQFVAEEDIDGLGVYLFRTDVQDIPYGNDPTFGLPVFMDMVIEEKVEPNTGLIVDGRSTRTFKVVLPAAMLAMVPEDLQALIPESDTGDGDIVVPAVIVNQQYSEETIQAKVADAKDLKTQLLWATQYGLWIGYGCGAILMILGFALAVRCRLGRKRPSSSEPEEIVLTSTETIKEVNQDGVTV